MRSEQCRTTSRSPQALLALVVALAACGQERPTQPMAPLSHQAEDTAGVLGAVVALINETNARADGARADPNFPGNCRGQGLRCWKIETTHWHVATGDRATAMLANLLGAAAVPRSPGGAPPACPWPTPAPGTGLRVAARVRFMAPDSAEVRLDRRCLYTSGSAPRGFAVGETFEVRRIAGRWQARITEAHIT